jgi:hypothetical protein
MRNVDVPPAGTRDLGTLTLVERDAVITGTVTDEHGTGVADVPVAARRARRGADRHRR